MKGKIYDGLFDSLYKKLELYLFRLFQIAKYLETCVKFTRINTPPIDEILDPDGYEGFVNIPPNPFMISDNDREFFYTIFDDFECTKEDDKSIRKLFYEIWDRIGEIKRWVGITKNTRFYGEKDSNSRLINEIDIFIKFPDSMKPIYSVTLGKHPEHPKKGCKEEEIKKYERDTKEFERILRQFQNFLLDREPIRGAKSYENYK